MEKRITEIKDEPSFFHEIYEYGSVGNSPSIAITAGIHGDEVTGIYVAEKLIEYFNNHEPKKGFVKIMPRCNPAAMRRMKRWSAYDETDMNRIFPGDERGAATMRAAHNIWEETKNAHIIIDLHCCSNSSMVYALAIYDEFPEVEKLVKKMNIENLVQSEGVGGQLFTEACRRRSQRAFIIELPSGVRPGAVNFDAADTCFEGLLSLLKNEGVINGNYADNPPISYGSIKDINSTAAGLWMPSVKNGQQINAGDAVGAVGGFNIYAPESGKVLITVPGSYVFSGDHILSYVKENSNSL